MATAAQAARPKVAATPATQISQAEKRPASGGGFLAIDAGTRAWSQVCEGNGALERFSLAPEIFDGKVKIEFQDGEDRAPIINFDSSILESLAEAWNLSVIFRPIGAKIRSDFMANNIREIMKIQGNFILSDLPKGFFSLKFQLEEDYNKVLSEGPWCVLGHYLAVQKWSADFNPLTNSIVHTPVWVRISTPSNALLRRKHSASHYLRLCDCARE